MSFRFGIRDLLISTTLIASGLGAFAAVFNPDWWWLVFWSPPLLFAGIFNLFKRPWLGAAFGCLLEPLFALALLLWVYFVL